MTAAPFAPVAASTDIVEIPFLIRGKVIEPGDDAVEYGGRTGGRFRTPNPRRYASQLVLANPSDLADLAALPIDEIIDFLAALGPRLALEDNPLMQRAYRMALEAGELTEPVLLPVYENVPALFDRSRLSGRIDRIVGKAYLDGWVEQGRPGLSTIRLRAVGTRNMHIIAGNVPIVAAMTVVNSALTKGDCLIKAPSNDPYTATAIVRTMIDMASDHPVTKHFAVGYWKGGDTAVEKEIYRPSRIEKLTAWGGMSSMTYIQRYLVPGIELIAMNPKLSISIVGHQALEDDASMATAAHGVALMAGQMNQTACSSTRLVYVEASTEDDDLDALERFGHAIKQAFEALPPHESTAPKRPDPELDRELEAIALDEEFYRVIGDSSSSGVVVSRIDEPVEFAQQLTNRIVNLVPVEDITQVTNWVSEETQTVGIYPESLREKLRDDLALHGVQRTLPLGSSLRPGVRRVPVDPDHGQRTTARRHLSAAPHGPLGHR